LRRGVRLQSDYFDKSWCRLQPDSVRTESKTVTFVLDRDRLLINTPPQSVHLSAYRRVASRRVGGRWSAIPSMKIAIVAVGTRGDIEPHLALAVRLQQRGHDVRFAAPLDFAAAAASLGLSYHPLRVRFKDLLRSDAGTALLTSSGQPLRFLSRLRAVAVPYVQRIIADVYDACVDVDVVCHSPLGLPAYFAARDRRIPCVSSSLQPLGRTGTFSSPLFPPHWHVPRRLNRASFMAIELAFWQCYRPFLKSVSASPLPAWNCYNELYALQKPMVFAFSSLIVPRPADWGPSMHVTGYWPLPYDRAEWVPPPALDDFLAAGPPPVCVGFGSMQTPLIGELLEMTVAAVRRAGTRAIVLTGWSGVRPPRSLLGDDVLVIEEAPHEWLFPRTAGVVHHGGAGTTAAACRAGVPSVILPFFFDQAFWGHVLHQRGIGPAPILHRHLSVDVLWRALQTLASGGIRARLRDLRARLHAEDGLGAAVTVIEDAMGRRIIPA
jgi:sterol 3beta-glucosyltransferase